MLARVTLLSNFPDPFGVSLKSENLPNDGKVNKRLRCLPPRLTALSFLAEPPYPNRVGWWGSLSQVSRPVAIDILCVYRTTLSWKESLTPKSLSWSSLGTRMTMMTTGLRGDRNDEDIRAATDFTGWLVCQHQGRHSSHRGPSPPHPLCGSAPGRPRGLPIRFAITGPA